MKGMSFGFKLFNGKLFYSLPIYVVACSLYFSLIIFYYTWNISSLFYELFRLNCIFYSSKTVSKPPLWYLCYYRLMSIDHFYFLNSSYMNSRIIQQALFITALVSSATYAVYGRNITYYIICILYFYIMWSKLTDNFCWLLSYGLDLIKCIQILSLGRFSIVTNLDIIEHLLCNLFYFYLLMGYAKWLQKMLNILF